MKTLITWIKTWLVWGKVAPVIEKDVTELMVWKELFPEKNNDRELNNE